MVGLGVAAAALGLVSPAFASPCAEGKTRYSSDSELTYTCEGGQWHEGPYGYHSGAQA